MAELTYEDYKQRINIQELLVDAGYTLNKRDGLRYPSYVRLDGDGRRVHGDKFIVTANQMCCFQPPERKNYNVISFIKEHPTLFRDYSAGMDKDRLVNLVCRRLLNEPMEERDKKIVNEPKREQRPFALDDYELLSFRVDDWESQKPFYPYFKNRGIDNKTQRAFAGQFFLASQTKSDGKTYANLAFPLRDPKQTGNDIIGFEERGKPNKDGKSYKGMAAGSDAQNGLWIAQPSGTDKPISKAKDIYWFESAYDAMAFYQLNREKVKDAVFVSTGGSPSMMQFRGMLSETGKATHHLCFDRDRAGQMFALNFLMQQNGRTFTSHITPKGQIVVTDMTRKFERYTLDLAADDSQQTEENFHRLCGILGLKNRHIVYQPADYPYKDWNDQLKGQQNVGEKITKDNEQPKIHR